MQYVKFIGKEKIQQLTRLIYKMQVKSNVDIMSKMSVCCVGEMSTEVSMLTSKLLSLPGVAV